MKQSERRAYLIRALLDEQPQYVCINLGEAMTAKEIFDRSIVIDADIAEALTMLTN